MPYITREDGERFVIPSYRDILSAKKQSLLRKEILLLSADYGDYITLHRKNVEQYEVAFSPESGYLLGETVWHYFKRPFDLIYCEAIPNTSEAILVIVKSGSVYLDGSFPIDSIPEELVIFRTQQNHFDIYIHGDVPISKTPEEGKFAFDPASVHTFTVLDAPVFPTLPTVKSFQLQLVESVLKAQGIGVFPIKKVITTIVIAGLLWMGWTYLTVHRKELPTAIVGVVNPYQVYVDALTSPSPTEEITRLVENIRRLYTIPGWYPEAIEYSGGKMQASVKSLGMKTSLLFNWANQNNATVQILQDGFHVTMSSALIKRPPPNTISPEKEVIGMLIDNVASVEPGNNLSLGVVTDRGRFTDTQITVSFIGFTPTMLDLLGQQFAKLPLVLSKVSIKVDKGNLTGSIILRALGN